MVRRVAIRSVTVPVGSTGCQDGTGCEDGSEPNIVTLNTYFNVQLQQYFSVQL